MYYIYNIYIHIYIYVCMYVCIQKPFEDVSVKEDQYHYHAV